MARRRVRQAGLSFTGFVVACVAKAVDEDRMLHAHRLGRGRLVLFEEVDRTTEPPRAEPERAANRKTVGEISAEIRSAARSPVSSVGMFGSSPGWGTPIPPAAARFAARLRELIESVDGLEEAPDIG